MLMCAEAGCYLSLRGCRRGYDVLDDGEGQPEVVDSTVRDEVTEDCI